MKEVILKVPGLEITIRGNEVTICSENLDNYTVTEVHVGATPGGDTKNLGEFYDRLIIKPKPTPPSATVVRR